MTVTVNGQRRELPDGATVAEAVAAAGAEAVAAAGTAANPATGAVAPRAGVQGAGIAVAVNETVVPRGAWTRTRLCEADRVEVLTAVQGG